MLVFIGPRRQTHLLRTMQRDERMPAWTTRTYSWLFRTPRFPAATYIFVAIDRLDVNERRLAAQFYRHLNAQGPGFRALNDPALAMDRYRLLRALHEAGINDFNAYLASESARPQRYPVFVRRNGLSTAPLTGLIETPAALAGELDALIARGEPPQDLLIIEYCGEPAEPGVYVKQAEYRFGDQYVPNASQESATWYVKYAGRIEVADHYHHRDREILATNPYAPLMRQVFELANIEYGRADFGFVGGRPQIYEINFNPDLRTQREQPAESALHRANWEICEDLISSALRAIDSPRGASVPTLSTPELRQFRLRFWRNYAPQRY